MTRYPDKSTQWNVPSRYNRLLHFKTLLEQWPRGLARFYARPIRWSKAWKRGSAR